MVTNYKVSVAVGVIIACLYGVTLWAAYDSLYMVSFMTYGNAYYLPLVVTMTVTAVAFFGVLTYTFWVDHAEDFLYYLYDIIAGENDE